MLFRSGDIYRLLQQPGDAVKEYQEAATQFDGLAKDYPGNAGYRRALAGAYNWLGETLRPLPDTRTDADTAYANALRLQQEIVRADPGNAEYPRELARTYYNRGILRYAAGSFAESEADFRAAIQLLRPLSDNQIGRAHV